MAFILNSPIFKGNPQAPTPLTSDNSTSLATTAFVKAQNYGQGTVTSIGVASANGISGSSSGGSTPSLTIALGAITPTSVNGLVLASLVTGFTIAGGSTNNKTLTVNNSITLSGSDGSTLNIGNGGSLGSAAYTAATSYESALGNPSQNGYVLASTAAGVRSWIEMSAGFTNPMNTLGDIMYQGASNATRLAGNTSTQIKALTSTGNGSAAVAPVWTDAKVTIGTTVINLGGTQTSISGLTLNSPTVSGTLTLAADPTLPLHAATKQYVDNAVAGLLDDRGSYDASGNAWPTTGGSGTAGAILKGDLWYISVSGTLGGQVARIGASIRALVDSPGQTTANWDILDSNIGFVPAQQNQTFYLGTTQIAINAGSGTITSIAGLSSVTSTTFIGNLTGNVSGTAASFTGNLTGDVTSTGMATTIAPATVTGKALTGFTLGTDSSALAATDTVLSAFQKLQYQHNLGLILGGSTKTTNYTTVITDRFVRVDATGGAFVITLLAVPAFGQLITFKKIDSSVNAVTISGNGKNIDDLSSITLNGQYNAISLYYNGTSWDVI